MEGTGKEGKGREGKGGREEEEGGPPNAKSWIRAPADRRTDERISREHYASGQYG